MSTGENLDLKVESGNLDWSELNPQPSDQKTQEAPKATEQKQASTETKPTQEPKAAEPAKTEGDGMILGKFKTQDDLVKSYQEIERYKTQLEQDRAFLKKQLDTITPAVVKPQGQDDIGSLLEKVYDDPKYIGEYVNKAVENKVRPVLENYVNMISEFQVNQTKQKYNDFGNYEGRITELLYTMPTVPKNANPVEIAYKMAKAENLDSIIREAEERGRKQVLESKAEKEKVFVESSGQTANGVPDNMSKLWEEAVKTGSWAKVIQARAGLK